MIVAIILSVLHALGLADAPPSSPRDHIPRGGLMECLVCPSECIFVVKEKP